VTAVAADSAAPAVSESAPVAEAAVSVFATASGYAAVVVVSESAAVAVDVVAAVVESRSATVAEDAAAVVIVQESATAAVDVAAVAADAAAVDVSEFAIVTVAVASADAAAGSVTAEVVAAAPSFVTGVADLLNSVPWLAVASRKLVYFAVEAAAGPRTEIAVGSYPASAVEPLLSVTVAVVAYSEVADYSVAAYFAVDSAVDPYYWTAGTAASHPRSFCILVNLKLFEKYIYGIK
jgi:hypothetical protein